MLWSEQLRAVGTAGADSGVSRTQLIWANCSERRPFLESVAVGGNGPGDRLRRSSQSSTFISGVTALTRVRLCQIERGGCGRRSSIAAFARTGEMNARDSVIRIERSLLSADGERFDKTEASLLADAVGEPVAFAAGPRPCGTLAQLDHDRVFDREPAEAMPVGSQGVGEHVGIAAVVLGGGDGDWIAEAVELFGVDRIDLEMVLERDLDDGTCGTSIATATWAALRRSSSPARVAHLGEARSPCAKALSPIIFPSAATRQT